MQPLCRGVFLTGLGPPTQRQCWWAAVLSHPGTVLSHASAAACHELRRVVGATITVTRVGNRGREHSPELLVSYSLTLHGQITERDGLPVTTVERTIIDLWPNLSAQARLRMLREGLRLRLTSVPRMHAAVRAHRGRRGVASLRVALEQLGALGLDRCRSDAEAWAVALIADAALPLPDINEDVAGEEADLSWPAARVIVEIDGPSYHVLRDEDIHKMKAWQAAGFEVRRISSDLLYADPARLLALVPHPSNVGLATS